MQQSNTNFKQKKMKKIILLTLITFNFAISQEIKLNPNSSIYDYSEINEFTNSNQINLFESKMRELNFSNISKSETSVSGESYFSILIMGTPLQVKYFVFIDFKENKYKLSISKFIIEDKRWSPVPLENIKSGKSRWISEINKKLPEIIKAIKTESKW